MFRANQKTFDTNAFVATILKWLKINSGLDDPKYNGRGIYLKSDNGPEQNVYPFATYDWVQAHTPLRFTDNTTNEIFEMTIKFESHGRNANDANDLAEQMRALLNSYHFDDYTMQNGFAVVSVSGTTDSTNFISIQEERSFGFTVTFRARNNFDDDYIPIDQVKIEQIK